MMTLEEKIMKLHEKQEEEIEKAKLEISAIKAEYEKNGYKTDKFPEKENEVIELVKDYYLVVINQMANKPDLSDYGNIANELERLINKKSEIIFKLTYPLVIQKKYQKSA